MPRRATLGLVLAAIVLVLLSTPAGLVRGTPSEASASQAPTTNGPPAAASAPNPFFTGMAASVALGAHNLNTSYRGVPPNASSFYRYPELACSDPSGNLWVPDFGGSRVLEFKPPFVTSEAASVFIGQMSASGDQPNATQSNLTYPGACTFDSHGNLWVSDMHDNRILEFLPPFSTGMNAALVLGQNSFNGNVAGTSANNLTFPVGLAFDLQGDLWVADGGNNRVLEYVPPFSTGMPATLVLGQTNFISRGAGLSASNFSVPIAVAYSAGILWVADVENNRVLGFDAPFSDGEGATYLLGQSSFVSSGATGAASLDGPTSVSVDSRGNLWVSDFTDNRVVEFLPPFSLFEPPAVAIGQRTLTSRAAGLNATALSNPLGAFVAASGALWVCDSTNNRVVEYVPSVYHLTFHVAGFPATKSWSVVVSGAEVSGTGANITVSEVNGSYPWSLPIIPGYRIAPTSGVASVNGTSVTVSLTATQVAYEVTFAALGLPATSNWSVVLGGVTHLSVANGTIGFTEPNGTYPFVVSNVSGFTFTPVRGSVDVNGTNRTIFVGFAPVSSSSSTTGLFSGEGILLLAVAFVLGLIIGLILMRRRKGGAALPAAPWTPPSAVPAPPPPEGSMPLPPPPPGTGSTPPGAVG